MYLKDSTGDSEGPAEKDIQIFFQLEKEIPLENMFTLWHHHLNGHESEQTPGDSEGQGSLACCSPWGRKESDTTEQLDDNNKDREYYQAIKPIKRVVI